MNVGPDDFRRHFRALSDETLLGTNRNELVEAARVCLEEEIARRGLNRASGAEASDGGSEPGAEPGEELTVIATYTSEQDAMLARGLLKLAEIPAQLAPEYGAPDGFAIHLKVRQELAEDALAVLADEISEEELAAQAEAAAFEEETGEEETGEEETDEEQTREDGNTTI